MGTPRKPKHKLTQTTNLDAWKTILSFWGPVTFQELQPRKRTWQWNKQPYLGDLYGFINHGY